MKQKTSQILFAYWNEVRGSRVAPRRFEIEPSRISEILPETFILERLDRETYRFRLAGTRICEEFGQELRGTNFLDGWLDDGCIVLLRTHRLRKTRIGRRHLVQHYLVIQQVQHLRQRRIVLAGAFEGCVPLT